MGMAQLSKQFVPRATGGTFLGDLFVSRSGAAAVMQTDRRDIIASGTVGNFRSLGKDSANVSVNMGITRCVLKSNTAGAVRADYEYRCQNGTGGVRTVIIASGETEDGGGAIGHKTKAGAVILGDIPTDMFMCINDGTDIGIYLNDGGVLKKLQSTGLFT